MTFTPTPEQTSIVEAATETNDNLLVNALAGAAKTSTLILVAQALRGKPLLCLAFNKKIADEMKERLPANCEAKTLNSLGNMIWKDAIGRWPKINTSKTYSILSALIEEFHPDERWKVFERLPDLIRAVDSGKSAGWIPDSYHKKSTRLLDDMEYFAWLDEEPEEWERHLIIRAYTIGLDQAFEGSIDFNDQILMPTVFFAPFPRPPVTLIDEAQDLSALNHAMLRKLVGKRRLIAVGDPNQAIYGFRGAHEDSMPLLKQEFSMRELFLSISFRCPIKVVEAARWRAPAMQWPEWAKEGLVEHLVDWAEGDILDGDVIICRNNAPLFSLAIKLLKNGRYPELVGNDIGKALVKVMKKFGKPSLPQAECYTALAEWVEVKKAKARNPGKVEDQAQCIRVFLDQGKTLGDAMAYAEHIFSVSGPIKLMTGHKSKGLEFNRVFFLDEFLLDKDGQDRNLRYVIITRAKETLTYAYSEHFQDEAEQRRQALLEELEPKSYDKADGW